MEGYSGHNDLHDRYQSHKSAYPRGQSTETVLLCVHSDIAGALDEVSMTRVIILDLFAAFDVIDHLILLKRLECSFGIKGNALTEVIPYIPS